MTRNRLLILGVVTAALVALTGGVGWSLLKDRLDVVTSW